MHISFDNSNPSKEDKVVICDDDDDLVEVPIENNTKMIMLTIQTSR